MIKTPNLVYVQNLSQISGPVCPQLFDLASFFGLSLLIRPNQQLSKKFFSNRSVQEKSFATYITGNL